MKLRALIASAAVAAALAVGSPASAAQLVITQTVDLTKATVTASSVTANTPAAFSPALTNSNQALVSNGDSVDYTVTFAPGQGLTLPLFALLQIGLVSPNNIGITADAGSTLRLFDPSGVTIATIPINGFTSSQANIVGDTFGNLGVPLSGTLGGLEFIDPSISVTGTNNPLTSQVLSLTATNGSFALVNVPSAVPEPASWALMLLGFLGIGIALRRRRTAIAAA